METTGKIAKGVIVEGLTHEEPATISNIQRLGNKWAVSFVGINSSRSASKMLTDSELDKLQPIAEEGKFNFQGDPEKFLLFAEAERINTAYQFDPLFAVNCSIIDPLPHQVEAVYKYLLPQPRIRFLLADDTGAGKTIMTGLLIKEMRMRGHIERVLIITPGGLTKQWQEDEMGLKFNIGFKLINREAFRSDPNVFQSSDLSVTSIDFVSQEDILAVAGQCNWDLIVIDECHKLSAYEYGSRTYQSRRYVAGFELSKRCEHLLLLTATPHRGRRDTFKKLLQLIDEDVFATDDLATERVKQYEKDGANKFFIRRLKEEMRDWDGNPLFKNRSTKTVTYELTSEEKRLYQAVTDYLTKRKAQASADSNIHVSLALTVMQRRLTSSIYAIKNTLEKRFEALNGIIVEVRNNPKLFDRRHRLDEFNVNTVDDFDDLDDDERDALLNILSDPRKFKLFTTSKSISELEEEAKEVRRLFEHAKQLYQSAQEEKKFQKLKELLKNNGLFDKRNEKLVIFTEHKDTLLYLEDQLSKGSGFGVATIHGGKSVDERRQAQWDFASDETQILIATDAAGEGINLQFCRLLINWDIPWNPNRLEQRMGRIHRYGQKEDVLVFNMVASNTKEGSVLRRLLEKLDIIREGIGDDRVYDVIQDVLQGVNMEDIIKSVFDGEETTFNAFINQEDEQLKVKFKEKIEEQKEQLFNSKVDFADASQLKEHSDEKRLQPIYVQLFFQRAFKHLGGQLTEVDDSIFRVSRLPDVLAERLRKDHRMHVDSLTEVFLCFDKQIFLDYHNARNKDMQVMHYINPGNLLFDTLTQIIRERCRGDMMKGTILVSPEDEERQMAFFVKSQILDNRLSMDAESIADEQLITICRSEDGQFEQTSPAKFLDMCSPENLTKDVEVPSAVDEAEITEWAFEHITEPQFVRVKDWVEKDTGRRKEYLETAFNLVIADLTSEINDLQGKMLHGSNKVNEKLEEKSLRLEALIIRKSQRIEQLEQMKELTQKPPDILGCAMVIPLSKAEYQSHFGMSRDDEAERIAMNVAMEFERAEKRTPEDVGSQNMGYDIKSTTSSGLKRYIEVKGRNGERGDVMLTENEMNRLRQLGERAWLYIVTSCKNEPRLFRIQDPGNKLSFEELSKGVQYFLKEDNWQGKQEE